MRFHVHGSRLVASCFLTAPRVTVRSSAKRDGPEDGPRLVLSGVGLGENTISILADEAVFSMDVFRHLRDEHFEKLLPKLAVGDHAILLQLWGIQRATSP